MKAIPEEDRGTNLQRLEFGRDPLPVQRSLGMVWNLQEDTLTFRITLPEKPFTRRGVLSVVNSLFDPLGFAIPVTLAGKLLLRQLTTATDGSGSKTTIGWDDPLPPSMKRKWELWKTTLVDLEKVAAVRCILPENSVEAQRIEIHGFADASRDAIGIAVYIKIFGRLGASKTSLLFAQTKLSPKQATTVPRLELCAAVLLVKAVKWINTELKLTVDDVTYYSDSKVVLGYLQNESRRFYVYVANRVQIIRSMSTYTQWKYVDTLQNPADMATRGKDVEHLMKSCWFTGPDFLNAKTDSRFPVDNSREEFVVSSDDPEVRRDVITCVTKKSETRCLGAERFSRFSTWNTLRRALSRLLRKVDSVKGKRQSQLDPDRQLTPTVVAEDLATGALSVVEVKRSENLMIRTVQAEAYPLEIDVLQHAEPNYNISRDSSIYRLNPFLDQHGVLRVGGRLRQADQMYEEKHPAILPKKSYLARLAVKHQYNKIYHQGRQMTHGAARQAGLWIVGAKRLISEVINQCVTCRRLRGRLVTQHMANLPQDRLDTPPPFTNVGFDVFGPWQVSTRKTRGGAVNSKRLGLVFTCLNCRAIHIEVLETMTASSFICALRRFFAVRGPPAVLRCERGTNFVGAKAELEKAWSEQYRKSM